MTLAEVEQLLNGPPRSEASWPVEPTFYPDDSRCERYRKQRTLARGIVSLSMGRGYVDHRDVLVWISGRVLIEVEFDEGRVIGKWFLALRPDYYVIRLKLERKLGL